MRVRLRPRLTENTAFYNDLYVDYTRNLATGRTMLTKDHRLNTLELFAG